MKNLSKLAVARPITFLMGSLILIGFGFFGLSNLRLNLYPDVSFPTITVYTTYDGVAPGDMETLITRPIEEAVGSVSGVQRVRSLSSQGATVVRLNFSWGTDLFFAETEVRKRLDQVRRSLPEEAEQPLVFSYDPNDEPVVVLTLTSDNRSPRELRTLSTQLLEQRLERIGGVASAVTAGGLDRQINVQISNAQMRAYDLDIGSISGRLGEENIQVPAGELSEGETTFSLRTIGDFQDINQIKNTIVAVRDGNPVYLDDIADVQDGIAQPIGNVRVQGSDGVIINLYRQSDSNVVFAANGVMNSLEEIRSILPQGVELDVLTNQADFIELSIRNLVYTGVQAILLVMLILLIFLRSGRSSLIVAISIPISIITTFSIMSWADVSLNIISLSGLTLAVGLVVDNAVVVLENIFRFKEDGENGKVASVKGAQEVAGPVVMSTLTTLVVFLPVLFVPGIAGLLFRDLALTISFALIVSVLVALTLIPVMSSRFFENETSDEEKDSSTKDILFKKVMDWRKEAMWKRIVSIPVLLVLLIIYPITFLYRNITKGVGGFFTDRVVPKLTRMFNSMEDSYNKTLTKVLPKSGWVVAAAFLLLLASLPIYFLLGGEFFPDVDENNIVLEVQREPGVNLFELERSIEQVEDIIRNEVPEARLVVSDYGDKSGIEGADNPGGNQGTVRIELVSVDERDRSQFEIAAALLNSMNNVPGANIRELREDPLSPDGETGLIVQIFGFDPEVKQELSNNAVAGLREVDGISNVFSSADQGRPELRIEMDRERISRVGLNTSQVATAVSNAVRGDIATTFVDQGVEFEVLVQLASFDRAESTALEEIQIQTPDGDWMPLKNLARIERFTGPSTIFRVDQDRMVELGADLDGIDLQTATEEARSVLDQINWPEGYRYEVAGSAEDQQQSFYYLMIAFLIAGVLTYMVMASQFESLVEPFIIIVTIPLALTGVLLILWITSTPVSVTAMVGLVLLTGIVVNNGIVMIDYIKILQTRGQERSEAIINGATRRLRPILMTAFTTILAMVPLALQLGAGSETWSPMARTVIGGLTMSTILMLFAVPCMYMMVNSLVERLGFDAVHKDDPLLEQEIN
ncbi:MAG: efflux RND transporter permease subunit [Balneolaceae bacterium]